MSASAALTALAAACGGGSGTSVLAGGTPSSAVPRTSVTVPAGGSVPAGFRPAAYTGVGADLFWLLGTVPCASSRSGCPTLVRSTDGGASFVSLPAPPAPVSLPGAGPEPGVVSGLRFADPSDGYAFSAQAGAGGVLFTTHDGASTWKAFSGGDVVGFALGGTTAYAVTARCTGTVCGDYRVERSGVSADSWSAVPLPFDPETPMVSVTAAGGSVWIMGAPAGPGGDTAVLVRSADGGRSFTTGAGPCYPDLPGSLAASSDRVVWAVCPTGMMAGALRSADAGSRFSTLGTPVLVNSARLAPASDSTAVLAVNGRASGLVRTTDSGSTWTAVSAPLSDGYLWWIGFTDPADGALLAQTDPGTSGGSDAVLLRTVDGGAHWVAVAL